MGKRDEGSGNSSGYALNNTIEESSDPINIYINRVKNFKDFKPLNTEEELRLAKLIKDTEEELRLTKQIKDTEKEVRLAKLIKDTREKLINHNLFYVVKIAQQFEGRGVSLEDLIEGGNLGLLEAVNRFDYSKGFRLSTFAKQHIEYRIHCTIAISKGISASAMKRVYKLSKLEKSISPETGRPLTDAEIIKELETDREGLAKLRETSHMISPSPTVIQSDDDEDIDLLERNNSDSSRGQSTPSESIFFNELLSKRDFDSKGHDPVLENFIAYYENDKGEYHINYTDTTSNNILSLAEEYNIPLPRGKESKYKYLNYYSKQYKMYYITAEHRGEIDGFTINSDDRFSLFREITSQLQSDDAIEDAIKFITDNLHLTSSATKKLMKNPSALDNYQERKVILIAGFYLNLSSSEVNSLLLDAGHDVLYSRMPGDCSLIFTYDYNHNHPEKRITIEEWEKLYKYTEDIIQECRDPNNPVVKAENALRDIIGKITIDDIRSYLAALNKFDDKYGATPSNSITKRVGDQIRKASSPDEYKKSVAEMADLFVTLRQRARRILLEAFLNYLAPDKGLQKNDHQTLNLEEVMHNYTNYFGWDFSGKDDKDLSKKLRSFIQGSGSYAMIDRTTYCALLSFFLHDRVDTISPDYFNGLLEDAGFLRMLDENRLDDFLFKMMNTKRELDWVIEREKLLVICSSYNERSIKAVRDKYLVKIPANIEKQYSI